MNKDNITVTQIQDNLVLTINTKLSNEILEHIKEVSISKAHKLILKFVIFEFTSLKILDSIEFEQFIELFKMLNIIGAKCIVTGLNPGIVMHLANSDINTSSFTATLNINDALAFINDQNTIKTDDK